MSLAATEKYRSRFYLTAIHKVIVALLVAGTVLLSMYVHAKAAFNFPPPWMDESALLWQAISFADGNTLSAPQMGETRPVLWMPPGYFVVLGVVFKVIGFSLAKARWLSWACSVASYIALLVFFADRRPRLLYWCLISLVFLDAHFVIMGNIARMEALVMALALWGFVMLKKGWVWHGLALLSGGVLVHPNGCYFLMAGGLWSLWRYRVSWPRPSLGAVALWGVLIGCSLVFLACVVANWQGFLHDMHAQFAEKAGNDIKGSFLQPKYLIVSGAFCILFLVSTFLKPAMLLQVFLGYAAVVVRLVGNEQWYVVFVPLSLLILMLSGLDVLALLMDGMRLPYKPFLRLAALCLCTVFFIRVGTVTSVIESFLTYPKNMNWGDYRMSSPVPYIVPADVQKLEPIILKMLVPGKTNIVHFSPRGDALFFWQNSKGRFDITDPTFRTPDPDLVVVHTYPSYARTWGDGNQSELRKWRITDADRVYTVGGSSEWFIKHVKVSSEGR